VTPPPAPALGFAELEGLSALVTGGASGIGEATSRRLAGAGAQVTLSDVDDERGTAVAASIGGTYLRLDVTDPQAWAELVATTGGFDIVHLNAGVSTSPSGTFLANPADDLEAIDDDTYRRIMAINVDGVVFGARAAAGFMRSRGRGVIVISASMASLMGYPPDPLYALTKHAVLGLARSIAPRLAATGTSVHAICPGLVESPFVSDAAVEILRSEDFPLLSPGDVAEVVLAAVRSPETGQAWVCQPGREPLLFRFPNPPAAKLPDGSTARPPRAFSS
jgi:NAD(P)-dependent dehydrogenase (short-subunit alcohol dehydrogenase family)